MPIPLDILPEAIRPRVGKGAPIPMRLMVARALLPMGPEDLFAALAYLATNELGEVRDTALKSLKEIPNRVVSGVVRTAKSTDILDFSVRQYLDDDVLVTDVLLNPNTSDQTFEWAARRVRGKVIDLIANNQERLIRHPPIVEGIYYNPEASMAVVSRVFETAVRNDVDVSHIPGYREIYESIFGKKPSAPAAVPVAPVVPDPAADEVPDELPVELLDVSAPVEEFLASELVGGLEDDEYVRVLSQAAKEDDSADAAAPEEERQSLQAMIAEMSVPQRIRLALVGSASARNILIRDSKTTVALSVLKNAKITEKEIAMFAKNKGLSELVIQSIARNREWTRTYSVQFALIQHPKTPPLFCSRWIRNLNPRDLKDLSRSREVPGYIQRLAKNIMAQREAPRGKR